ncbi:MAG: hypothetical protein CM15mP102_04590 [Flavobacteriales bacterium]|nr:MAG: hypothetical protein CM15mP102_04590 [Flavobacteriales bacterium]
MEIIRIITTLNLDIKILDLIINNFYQINKNPISGIFYSEVNIKRNMENRTLIYILNCQILQIKNYDLGELNINIFGNTDYDSYAVNIDMLKDNLILLKVKAL